MDYQWLNQFISSPQLPDVIAYVLFGASMIAQYFIKRFVKRDNLLTTTKIDIKVAKLKFLEKKMEESNKQLEIERLEWKNEKAELKKEIDALKKAVRCCSVNTKELVINGVSNEVAKLLPVDDTEE